MDPLVRSALWVQQVITRSSGLVLSFALSGYLIYWAVEPPPLPWSVAAVVLLGGSLGYRLLKRLRLTVFLDERNHAPRPRALHALAGVGVRSNLAYARWVGRPVLPRGVRAGDDLLELRQTARCRGHDCLRGVAGSGARFHRLGQPRERPLAPSRGSLGRVRVPEHAGFPRGNCPYS